MNADGSAARRCAVGKGKSHRQGRHRLTIIHTNDTHSHLDAFQADSTLCIGGVVGRAAFVDSVRRADGRRRVLLVDAGDYSQGTPYFSTFGGKAEIKAMNIMGYDVACVGNHEFDNGVENLVKRLRRARFKSCLCNYRMADVPDRGAFGRRVKPYVTVRRAGMKIAFVGVLGNIRTTVDLQRTGGMNYVPPSEVVPELALWLKEKKKCDMVILLSHCGLNGEFGEEGDIEMAPRLRGVDLIIGGHTHSFLDKPVFATDADGRPLMIVTAYWKSLYAGLLHL